MASWKARAHIWESYLFVSGVLLILQMSMLKTSKNPIAYMLPLVEKVLSVKAYLAKR